MSTDPQDPGPTGAPTSSGDSAPVAASLKAVEHFSEAELRRHIAMLLRRVEDRNRVIKALSKGAINFGGERGEPEEQIPSEDSATMYFYGLARGNDERAYAAETQLRCLRRHARAQGRFLAAQLGLLRDLGQRISRLRARERHWMQRASDLAVLYAHVSLLNAKAVCDEKRLLARLEEVQHCCDKAVHNRMTIECVGLLLDLIGAEIPAQNTGRRSHEPQEIIARIRKVLDR